MSLSLITALVLALAAVLGTWRIVRNEMRWRWLLLPGQWVMAILLYLVFFPPTVPRDPETALLLTLGANTQDLLQHDADLKRFALPGVSMADSTLEQVPDLATLLRRHPQIGHLRILGDGLSLRDRETVANRGLDIDFEMGEEPVGVVELQLPDVVNAGTLWTLRGRVSGVAKARLEMRDRSDAISATVQSDEDGHFRLALRAKVVGQALYRLRVLGSDDTLIEELPIAIVVSAGEPVRTTLVAGAPDADLKYLRRWAIDAGNPLASRIALSRGLEQQQNTVSLDPKSLAETDLLILDERAWSALAKSEKSAIGAALDQGLGVLLRVTGPLPPDVVSEWSAFGFQLEAVDIAQSVAVANEFAETTAQSIMTRRPVRIEAADAVALITAVDGSILASWRAKGQGRVGIWLPLDSYRILLSDDPMRYGTLWSRTFATLARARADRPPDLPALARVGERSVLCDLDSAAAIEDADGIRHELLVEGSTPSCAAWWPSRSGWHTFVDASGRWPFRVYALDEAQALFRAQTRQATAQSVRSGMPAVRHDAELPRWPFFLAWLFVTALLWLLERHAARKR